MVQCAPVGLLVDTRLAEIPVWNLHRERGSDTMVPTLFPASGLVTHRRRDWAPVPPGGRPRSRRVGL